MTIYKSIYTHNRFIHFLRLREKSPGGLFGPHDGLVTKGVCSWPSLEGRQGDMPGTNVTQGKPCVCVCVCVRECPTGHTRYWRKEVDWKRNVKVKKERKEKRKGKTTRGLEVTTNRGLGCAFFCGHAPFMSFSRLYTARRGSVNKRPKKSINEKNKQDKLFLRNFLIKYDLFFFTIFIKYNLFLRLSWKATKTFAQRNVFETNER